MAENKTIDQITKELNKKFGDEKHKVAQLGVDILPEGNNLSLGSPGLDYCLYNNLQEKRFIEIFGGEGSGKTSLAYLIAGNFQRKELDRHPDNPRHILFVDCEHTADPIWAANMGYDMSETAVVPTDYFAPLDMNAEDIFDYIRDYIKTDMVGLIILDSIPMLVGKQVYDESFGQKEFGGIAKVLTTFVARVTSLLKQYDCTFIGINDPKDNIGGYGLPYVTPGGHQWKHACSVRLMIKRGDFLDENYEKLTTSAESPAAYRMDMAVCKTKVCRWDRKLGSTIVSYTDGIDVLQDTIDTAIKIGLIDSSTQGSYKLIDPDTGEILLDADGNEIKIRGKKNVKPYFKEHIDLYRKLYDKVYEMISRKDDSDRRAFEAMMNMNKASEEVFGFDLNAAGVEDI